MDVVKRKAEIVKQVEAFAKELAVFASDLTVFASNLAAEDWSPPKPEPDTPARFRIFFLNSYVGGMPVAEIAQLGFAPMGFYGEASWAKNNGAYEPADPARIKDKVGPAIVARSVDRKAEDVLLDFEKLDSASSKAWGQTKRFDYEPGRRFLFDVVPKIRSAVPAKVRLGIYESFTPYLSLDQWAPGTESARLLAGEVKARAKLADSLQWAAPRLYGRRAWKVEDWKRWTTAKVAALRAAAPKLAIYPILRFQFDDKGYPLIAGPYFAEQLVHVRGIADGLIIGAFGTASGDYRWSATDPWWIEAKKFAAAVRSGR